jgi:hypothetical protein
VIVIMPDWAQRIKGTIKRTRSPRGDRPFMPTEAQKRMVIALAAVPRPLREIATLIIDPSTGKHIDEELVMRAFAEELKSAQAKYDLMCSKSIASRMQEGSDAANALWARNKWGWDRPNSTMTFKVPDQNGDIGDDNKIIIELVRAPKRED